MGIMSRLGNILKGKANKALDDMEDPTEQLDLSIQQKKEAFRNAKRESGELLGSVRTKENKIKELENELKDYEDAVRRALADNNEEAAEKIITTKIVALENKIKSSKVDYDKTKAAADQIKTRMNKLEEDISQLEASSANLKARYKTAQAQGKVNELLAGVDKESNVSISDIEQKIEATENYAEGLSEYASNEEDEDISKYINGSSDIDVKSRLDKYRQ